MAIITMKGEFLWQMLPLPARSPIQVPYLRLWFHSTGIAGSYTRFCILNNFYTGSTAAASCLLPWLKMNARSPGFSTVGWNIETIFPYKTNLYIGSTTGVFIFNTNNPYRPHQISAFSHVTGCDPVVCANDLALWPFTTELFVVGCATSSTYSTSPTPMHLRFYKVTTWFIRRAWPPPINTYMYAMMVLKFTIAVNHQT